MRDNGQVTVCEVDSRDSRPLLSRTNTNDTTAFANRAPIDISGFTERELIGSPHNFVRHPHKQLGSMQILRDIRSV